jgi:hypothetical protein
MDETFARLQRRIDMTQRNYRNALHELERLQAAEPQLDPDPVPLTPRPQTTNPENGFLPQATAATPIPHSPTDPPTVPGPRREPLLP